VTIRLPVVEFLWVVHSDHASIWHRYGDITPQRQRVHEFDLLESRDVIGHVTVRLPVVNFLSVFHSSIWRSYGDIAPQI